MVVASPPSISLSVGGCIFMFSLTLTGSAFFAVSYSNIFFISMVNCCHSLSNALEVNSVMIFVQEINRAFDKWMSYSKSPLVLFDFSLTRADLFWKLLSIICFQFVLISQWMKLVWIWRWLTVQIFEFQNKIRYPWQNTHYDIAIVVHFDFWSIKIGNEIINNLSLRWSG